MHTAADETAGSAETHGGPQGGRLLLGTHGDTQKGGQAGGQGSSLPF